MPYIVSIETDDKIAWMELIEPDDEDAGGTVAFVIQCTNEELASLYKASGPGAQSTHISQGEIIKTIRIEGGELTID